MKGKIGSSLIALFVIAGAFVYPAAAQSDVSAASSSKPVAYVYVSRPTHIDGFAASSSGKLTPLPGSPLANTSVVKLAATKKFLFGENSSGNTITSFSIASNGSIKKVATVNVASYAPDNYCPGPFEFVDIQADPSGSTLYHQENTNCATTGSYLSFHIESNGHLQFLGDSGGAIDGIDQGDSYTLSTLDGYKFAFDGNCEEDNNNLPVIDVYQRHSNGALMYAGQSNQVPLNPTGNPYCVGIVAADTTNHLAVALQRIDVQYGDNGYLGGPYFLASYTADTAGNLTTTSTPATMPEAAVGQTTMVGAMSISPANKYLAVGGPGGFEVFHFNGSKPITKFSGVEQPNVGFFNLAWDKSNHLYVLGGGNLYVYSVTSSGVKQAAGSPYSIPESSSVSVLALQ